MKDHFYCSGQLRTKWPPVSAVSVAIAFEGKEVDAGGNFSERPARWQSYSDSGAVGPGHPEVFCFARLLSERQRAHHEGGHGRDTAPGAQGRPIGPSCPQFRQSCTSTAQCRSGLSTRALTACAYRDEIQGAFGSGLAPGMNGIAIAISQAYAPAVART